MSARLQLILVLTIGACQAPWAPPVPGFESDPFERVTIPAQAPRPRVLPPCQPGMAARIDGTYFSSVTGAFAASQPRDTIEVCPGTWYGYHLIAHAGPVSIVGVTGDAEDVSLVALAGGYSVRTNQRGTNLRLQALTISSPDGHGVHSTGRDPTGNNNTVVQIYDCIFTDIGDGVFASAALNTDARFVHISRSRFHQIRGARSGAALTLGTHVGPTNAYVEESEFYEIEGRPAILSFSGENRNEVLFDDVVFRDNVNTDGNPLLHFADRDEGDLIGFRDVLFENNTTIGGLYQTSPPGYTGLGVLSVRPRDGAETRVWMLRTDVRHNTSPSATILLHGARNNGDLSAIIVNSSFTQNTVWDVTDSNRSVLDVGSWAEARLRNVDMGIGANANDATDGDFTRCATDYGSGTSGLIATDLGWYCPQ